jgi:hypothetical protein
MSADRWGWGENRAPTVPGLFGRGRAHFIKKKYSKYYHEELKLFSYNIHLHCKHKKPVQNSSRIPTKILLNDLN